MLNYIGGSSKDMFNNMPEFFKKKLHLQCQNMEFTFRIYNAKNWCLNWPLI